MLSAVNHMGRTRVDPHLFDIKSSNSPVLCVNTGAWGGGKTHAFAFPVMSYGTFMVQEAIRFMWGPERLAREARARERAKQLRDAALADQQRSSSRLDAMEHRFAQRILSRRGSTDDRMLSWTSTLDRFLKLVCGNFVCGRFGVRTPS